MSGRERPTLAPAPTGSRTATAERLEDAAHPVTVHDPDAGTPLFRDAAIESQRSQWLGTVVLTRPVSQRVFVGLSALLLIALALFITLAQFTRRANVTGWLVPDAGLVRVYAPASGIVSAVLVEEGSQVHRGQSLVVLSNERRTLRGGDANVESTRRIEERIAILQVQRDQQQQLFAQQASTLRARIRVLRAENRQIDSEIGVQRQRVQLLGESVERLVTLEKSGYASPQQTVQQRDTLLDNTARLRSMGRTRLSNERDIAAAEAELLALPINQTTQAAALEKDVSELEQQRSQSEATRELVLAAPQDGIVTAVQADVGGATGTSAPVVTILPRSARLQAQLFSPSRSVGFVAPGQRVTIRYPAYPYQKFGHQLGTVRAISRNALAPSELPPQLSGLTSVLGSAEPVYRITVDLDAQAIRTGKGPQALTPGMLLEADIALERRSLLEWMLNPVLSITERR